MTTVAVIVLIVSLGGAAITGLVIAGRWVLRHDAERTAAATFADAYILDSSEAALAQSAADDEIVEAWLDEMVATLDDAKLHIERLRRAAA